MRTTIADGRGRKREARQWLRDLESRLSTIQPLSQRRVAWERDHTRLRRTDPGLAEAVSRCLFDDIAKAALLTHEEWRAQFLRRVETVRRERRAERQSHV